MAALNDLIQKIENPELRAQIQAAADRLVKQKKFGLVFEEHLPECTPLYDIPVRKGAKVSVRNGKANETYTVLKIEDGVATCLPKNSKEAVQLAVDTLVTTAELGDPIYPCLQPLGEVCNAPDSGLWHTLIEADNYHALQMLEYLYAGKVDCIYIDWRSKFENDPDNELVRIYADRGISGSNAYKRPEFMSMMKDARNRKFDVIHTKSVSRFARNTVQLLEAVRELRDLGIEVLFEKEQISTLQPTSELFLTIAATIAENDLEVDSQRQKWSFQHRFENGWYSIGSSMYGYRMTEDNKVVIVPEEAEVIRWVYDMYLSGCGCPTIARVLNEAGIQTGVGMPWRASGILKMISNEKYMGDVMMGKSVNIDGKKCDNLDGQYGERYYIEDAHEGIISKDTYYKAMELRQQRANPKLVNQDTVEYPFTRMISCGCCGSYFRHKVNNPGKKWKNDIWICARQEQKGKAHCDSTRIKDTVLKEKFVEAYNEFVTLRPEGETIEAMQKNIQRLRVEEEKLAALLMRKLLSEKAFRVEQQAIKAEIRRLQEQLQQLRCSAVRESDYTPIEEFDEAKLKLFIEKIIIMEEKRVIFRFFNGVEITKEYTNGKSGNKPGWNLKEA